jgi:hypothetical protein
MGTVSVQLSTGRTDEVLFWHYVEIASFAPTDLPRGCQPVIRQGDLWMPGKQIARSASDIHSIQLCRMQMSLPIHGNTPEFLPAGPAKDEGEGGTLLSRQGTDWAGNLAPVVEVRASGVEAGSDSTPVGEEGMKFGCR